MSPSFVFELLRLFSTDADGYFAPFLNRRRRIRSQCMTNTKLHWFWSPAPFSCVLSEHRRSGRRREKRPSGPNGSSRGSTLQKFLRPPPFSRARLSDGPFTGKRILCTKPCTATLASRVCQRRVWNQPPAVRNTDEMENTL